VKCVSTVGGGGTLEVSRAANILRVVLRTVVLSKTDAGHLLIDAFHMTGRGTAVPTVWKRSWGLCCDLAPDKVMSGALIHADPGADTENPEGYVHLRSQNRKLGTCLAVATLSSQYPSFFS